MWCQKLFSRKSQYQPRQERYTSSLTIEERPVTQKLVFREFKHELIRKYYYVSIFFSGFFSLYVGFFSFFSFLSFLLCFVVLLLLDREENCWRSEGWSTNVIRRQKRREREREREKREIFSTGKTDGAAQWGDLVRTGSEQVSLAGIFFWFFFWGFEAGFPLRS